MARIDDQTRQSLIQSARDIIYDLNRPVDSERVENLLKKHSYVPTEVCRPIFLRLVSIF